MQFMKEDLKDWYMDLSEESRMRLWQRFAIYLNDYELKNCMADVRSGNGDLFEIHHNRGYIEKYQIYFNQIMRNLGEEGDNGRED